MQQHLGDFLPQDGDSSHHNSTLGRREFLRGAGALAAAAGLSGGRTATASAQSNGAAQPAKPNEQNQVQLSRINNPQTEAAEKTPEPSAAPDERVGFAIVGLGRLTINQILPAFGKSKYCKPVALVTGSDDGKQPGGSNLEKGYKLASQYGIPRSSVYSYADYEKLAQNPAVKVIYIVLPNSMHAEYVVRGAAFAGRTGKHILCEKPMATSAADCEKMVAACRTGGVKLMIAYRQQYEPMNRAVEKMVREGKLGALRSLVATNTQNQGDPAQWRLKRKLAGGGCLPDVGIYCLNAARFLSGEEPSEVFGQVFQPAGDTRFAEVEATCNFLLRFPSGLQASCVSGYAGHRSQMLRLEGSDAWAELSPAFAYTGLKLRTARLMDGKDVVMEPGIENKDQFAAEMDHMALCVLDNLQPHTPGEEGLQDQRVIEAIYESARTGRAVKVAVPARPTRGAPLPDEAKRTPALLAADVTDLYRQVCF